MEDKIERLKILLEEEVLLHDTLIENAKEMTEALKCGNVEKVALTSMNFDIQAGRIEEVESTRTSLCNQLAKACGIKDPRISITAFMSFFSATDNAFFKKIRDVLKNKIAELARINTCNQILIGESLRAFAKSVQLATSPDNGLKAYTSRGAAWSEPVVRNLINSIA